MNDPIQLYPGRVAPEPEQQPTPDEAQERRSPEELRYQARWARRQRDRQQNAERHAGMTPLSEALRPWMQRHAMPARCPECGYSGVVREEPTLTEDDRLVYTRVYCDCVWAEKARKREQEARMTMIDDMRKQHAARLRKKLVLPSAYTGYTLETHPLARYNPTTHQNILDWLYAWDWRRGLMLRGPYGRGKTAYLVAIMQALLTRAVDEGWGMLYTGGADMLARLQDGFDDDTYARTRDELSTVHLLAIDDLGASQQVTKWRQDQYLAIFEARYANDLPLFITTNLSDGDLKVHLTERVYWRLVERCDLIDVDGPNLRDANDVRKWQKGKGGK